VSVDSVSSGSNTFFGAIKDKATSAKDFIANKFNAAVDDVKTTDSKPLKIAKAIGYGLAAIATFAFLLFISAPIAYFCSPALIGVFGTALAIGVALTIGLGIKAAIYAVAAHRSGKTEDIKPENPADQPDQTDGTAGEPESTASAQVTATQISAATAGPNPQVSTEKHLTVTHTSPTTGAGDPQQTAGNSKVRNFFAAIGTWIMNHKIAVLSGVLVILTIALCMASFGVGFGFILTAVMLAGAGAVAGKIVDQLFNVKDRVCDWFADRKEVSEKVNEEIETFKLTGEYTNASDSEKKVLLLGKRDELEVKIKREVAERRTETNQIKAVMTKCNVSQAEAKEILTEQKAHDATLEEKINELDDSEGLNITSDDVKKQLEKAGHGGDYHTRLQRAKAAKDGNVEEAKAQLETEDKEALDALKNEGMNKMDARIDDTIKKYRLSDIEPQGRRTFIAKQIMIEEGREARRLRKETGLIPDEKDVRAHCEAFSTKISSKFESDHTKTKLSADELNGIRDGLHEEEEAKIKSNRLARHAETVHENAVGEMVDEINFAHDTNITPSRARKYINEHATEGAYRKRWDKALKNANGNVATAQKTIAEEDTKLLNAYAKELSGQNLPQEKIASIVENYNLSSVENGQAIAREMLIETRRRDVWMKNQRKKTNLSEDAIRDAIKPSDQSGNHMSLFLEKVQAHLSPTTNLEEAVQKAIKEIYDDYAKKIEEKLAQA
jgi:hypothetical protein